MQGDEKCKKMHTIYTNDIDQENDASAAADVA